MELQKEIKTSRFESVFQQAVVNVFYTYSWCTEQMKQIVAPYEITTQQFNVLRILRGQHPKPSTINLIKSRMMDKMSDASRIVDRLVQKGLVEKEINTTDKRAVDIRISRKGLSLLKRMDEEVDLSAMVSSNLTEEEALQLNLLLDKLRG
ncbi:MarR family winged helix-turn-helix transcriptional regulator [Pedobacter sp.]|jgi:DNA-binding MarR family transcriptional regulator|uniref:MarR family winged helix-turn-helix transcriptional regulator n=1 Tax=Pedobacter sp. TaxID=1411316 RepID=UPI002C5B17A2|nr:MarR family transcriptional regulator [Pedobacter sp.]HWW42841.1 MarR family transcriptional regulator [Pedobacter sp.]